MGIDGLLQFFKPVTYSGHISVFRKQKAAIDVMGWLYRGAYSCALELATNQPTDHYLVFTHNMINVLKTWEIKSIFCIDGRNLKAKDKTNDVRLANKEKEKAKANEILQSGNEYEARKAFTRCLDVTKEMIYRLIDMLNALEIEFIVAPFEADAQVAYLCRKGYADFGISEDSDQLCYNSPLTVYKLGTFGECEYIDLRDLRNRRKAYEKFGDETIETMLDLSETDFIFICILSGTDYLPSIKGMGIKKAINYFSRFGTLENVIKRMKIEQQFRDKVPEGYEELVKKISKVFLYQLVYDPESKSLVTFNPNPDQAALLENDKDYIGRWFPNAEKFAKGQLDIETLKNRVLKSVDVKEILGLKKSRKNNKDLVKKSQSMINISHFQVRKSYSTVIEKEKFDFKVQEDLLELNFPPVEEEEMFEFQQEIFPDQNLDDDEKTSLEIDKKLNDLSFEIPEDLLEGDENTTEVRDNSDLPRKASKKRKEPSFLPKNGNQTTETDEEGKADQNLKEHVLKKHKNNNNANDLTCDRQKISIFLSKSKSTL